MKYRTIPEVRAFNGVPIVVHVIQEKRWHGWKETASVLTVEQVDVTLKALEESNKKKG